MIQKINIFERGERELKEGNSYEIAPGQFDANEIELKKNILSDPEEKECDSDGSSDIFVGSAVECDFVRLQRDFYWKYGEHKELLHYVWEVMHNTSNYIIQSSH